MTRKKTEPKDEFYVVGIGASAGGLDAIQVLFDNMPSDTGMAFVVVQHLSPTFKSLMDELLAKHTSMPIKLAKDGTVLEPNHIYLNPKDKNIICQKNTIHHLDKDSSYPLNLPIDIFFHSLGSDKEDKSIGIILSGTGTDGSRGISTIKESGGTVIVQEPESAQFDGMPITAINSHYSDYVLQPDKIGEELLRIASSPKIKIKEPEKIDDYNESLFSKIVEILSNISGIDFSLYKPNTLIRRIEKRVNINQLSNLEDYYKLLQGNSEEQKILYNDCLIGVTSFFRDPDAFKILKEKILPRIFSTKNTSNTARFWVAGCSTGEEAYSLAILIDEYLVENKLTYEYKIFATDADTRSIQIGNTGRYPVNLVTDISKERLEKYFIKSGDHFEVLKRIRERIVFSVHNILKDPPFIRMDFVSCRNLLIYMNTKSQQRILNTFQFSLNLNAYLFLGNSESINDPKERFEVIDAKWRIYKNISDVKKLPSITNDNKLGAYKYKHPQLFDDTQTKNQKHLPENLFNKNIAEEFGPDCIYIDQNYNILFLNGKVDSYLTFGRGHLKYNLMDMVTSSKLAPLLRNGIRRLKDENKIIVFNKFSFNDGKEDVLVNIKFKKVDIDSYAKDIIAILFEKVSDKQNEEIVYNSYEADEFSRQRIEDLESELKEAKEETQNVIEELETSNEELQASNEELQASNEELQSTNEELQSVNEELYTVNSELQGKNKELYDLNNDMSNMLNSTNIAVLFLDKDLKIRTFTPELKRIFSLRDTDVGRPIEGFASNFINISGKELSADIKKAIDDKKPFSKELVSEDNRTYLKRILPYKISENHYEGAVIAFIDITEVYQKDQEVKDLNERLEQAMKIGKLAWWSWDYKTGNVVFSDAKAYMLGYKPEELDGDVYAFTKMIHPDDYDKAMQAMRDHLEGKKDIYEIEYRIQNKNGKYSWFYDKGGIIERDKAGKPLRIAGVVIDISNAIKQDEKIGLLHEAFMQSPNPKLITDVNGAIQFVNQSFCSLTGYKHDELIGKQTNIFKSGKHSNDFYRKIWNKIGKKQVWRGTITNKKKNGDLFNEEATIAPVLNAQNEIVNYFKVSHKFEMESG